MKDCSRFQLNWKGFRKYNKGWEGRKVLDLNLYKETDLWHFRFCFQFEWIPGLHQVPRGEFQGVAISQSWQPWTLPLPISSAWQRGSRGGHWISYTHQRAHPGAMGLLPMKTLAVRGRLAKLRFLKSHCRRGGGRRRLIERSYGSRAVCHGQLERAMRSESILDSSFLSTEGFDKVSTELPGFTVEVIQDTGGPLTRLLELLTNDLVVAFCMC